MMLYLGRSLWATQKYSERNSDLSAWRSHPVFCFTPGDTIPASEGAAKALTAPPQSSTAALHPCSLQSLQPASGNSPQPLCVTIGSVSTGLPHPRSLPLSGTSRFLPHLLPFPSGESPHPSSLSLHLFLEEDFPETHKCRQEASPFSSTTLPRHSTVWAIL